MRALTHSFLFCCPLRTGGVAVAVAHMLTAGILLYVDGVYLDDFDARFDSARRAGAVDGTVTEYNLEKLLLLIDLLIQALGFGFAIFLMLGALKGKARLVLAWAVFALLAFVLYASRTVGLNLSGWHSRLAHSCSTLALVSVVTLYSVAAMLKLQQELREVACARPRARARLLRLPRPPPPAARHAPRVVAALGCARPAHAAPLRSAPLGCGDPLASVSVPRCTYNVTGRNRSSPFLYLYATTPFRLLTFG